MDDCAGCWGQRTRQVPDPSGRLWKEGRAQATLFLHAKEKVILVFPPSLMCVCVASKFQSQNSPPHALQFSYIHTHIYEFRCEVWSLVQLSQPGVKFCVDVTNKNWMTLPLNPSWTLWKCSSIYGSSWKSSFFCQTFLSIKNYKSI